jgi:SAM-dependent methyltransferase
MMHKLETLVDDLFKRAFKYGRRWDEALWRLHEVWALQTLLEGNPEVIQPPILDLGCGNGDLFRTVFGDLGQAYGVDPGATRVTDPNDASISGSYVEVRARDGSDTGFQDAFFGMVFSNSTLEHINPIDALLREVSRVLKPGGWFVFTTPDPAIYDSRGSYWAGLPGQVGKLMGKRFERLDRFVYSHASIFTREEWGARLNSVGLRIEMRREYVPYHVARVISCFSAASRIRFWRWAAVDFFPVGRWGLIQTNCPEREWVERCRKLLSPLYPKLEECDLGCGQLIVARKPIDEHVS